MHLYQNDTAYQLSSMKGGRAEYSEYTVNLPYQNHRTGNEVDLTRYLELAFWCRDNLERDWTIEFDGSNAFIMLEAIEDFVLARLRWEGAR